MAVKFGVFVPQGWRMDLVDIEDPEDKYEAMTMVGVEAEKLGFDSIWLYDHFHNVPEPVVETNFDSYRQLRINEAPQIEVHLLDSSDPPGGMGEPTVALVAPAVCNAIHAATGRRLRKLPIVKQGLVV